MKNKIVVLSFLLFVGSVVRSQAPEDGAKTIKVLSFNILHGATTKGDFNLDVIARVINYSKPDLVALQEVDFKTRRAKGYDLVTELGNRTKLMPLFGSAMPYDGGEYGEGILSKYSILKSNNVSLPYSEGNEPRAALEIITVIPSGDTISFIGTHLDHTKDETDRIVQAQKINETFSSNEYPTILAGDLNAIPGSKPINILQEMWASSYKSDSEFTFPSDNPNKKIDYVMFYPENRWKVIESLVICDTMASDHCAYLVTLELLDE